MQLLGLLLCKQQSEGQREQELGLTNAKRQPGPLAGQEFFPDGPAHGQSAFLEGRRPASRTLKSNSIGAK